MCQPRHIVDRRKGNDAAGIAGMIHCHLLKDTWQRYIERMKTSIPDCLSLPELAGN